jgi:hypothetical protein
VWRSFSTSLRISAALFGLREILRLRAAVVAVFSMLSPEPPAGIFSQEGTRISGSSSFRRFTCSVENVLCCCNARSRRFFLFTPQLFADVAEHAEKPITRTKGGRRGAGTPASGSSKISSGRHIRRHLYGVLFKDAGEAGG